MIRWKMLVALILAAGMLAAVMPAAGEEAATLGLEKECVVVGRIQGADVKLFPMEEAPGGVKPLADMTRIRGFELLNLTSGDWQPLSLSEEGYFSATVRMGQYDLRGRDCKGLPYLIHRFNVPLNMAVNLGTFQVETCDPGLVFGELWHDYDRTANWREYREGVGHVALRLKHNTGREAYDNCEHWFASSHEELYEHFAKVMARR